MSLVFIHAYVGTLASFLSVPKFKPVITKLEDLPGTKLTWVVRQGTELEPLFMVRCLFFYDKTTLQHGFYVIRKRMKGSIRLLVMVFASGLRCWRNLRTWLDLLGLQMDCRLILWWEIYLIFHSFIDDDFNNICRESLFLSLQLKMSLKKQERVKWI